MNRFEKMLASNFNDLGCLTFKPYVVVSGEKAFPDHCSVKIHPDEHLIHLTLGYGRRLAEDLFVNLGDGEMTATRSIRNLSEEALELNELGVELGGIAVGGALADDYFYHVENPRIYDRMAINVNLKRTQEMATASEFDALAGNRWADPGVVSDRIGASPYQPFPAILVSNYESPKGLVHGTLSQRVFYHNYLLAHVDGAIQLDILSSFKAVSYRILEPGETLKDEWYLGTTDEAAELQQCFARYTDVLRRKLPTLYGATPINRHSLVWGSWNDGHGPKITEEQILKTANILTEHFPTVEWVQLDDGYATLRDVPGGSAHGLGVPYEGEAGIAKNKFPQGLKAYTDQVKQTGLRPAVWIGGALPSLAPLSKDHPEWFVDYSLRTPNRRVFDVSNPEARDYMCQALDYFLKTCGFEAVKHDFWSYAFEDSRPLLADKARSGYEWRDWWLKEVRKRLPGDGYFQTGCDIVMANPFLGEFFTNYRYGIDISEGNWEHVKTTMLWGAACFALNIGDLFVPNSDAVGLFPGLSDTEAMLCINYCLISRSMVEIAGWLYDVSPDTPRFKALQKAVCCPNNGGDVFFVNYDYRKTNEAPFVWYFKGPFFSLLEENPFFPVRTVALFNTADIPQVIGFDFTDLGLLDGEYVVCDVWDRDVVESTTHRFEVELPPHASRLFSVTPAGDSLRLLDANVKIDKIAFENGQMQIALAHSSRFEFRLNQRPVSLHIDDDTAELKTTAVGLGYVVEGVGSDVVIGFAE